MMCPECQSEPAAGAIFCNHCGHSLPIVCQRCTAANPPGSYFCHRCGGDLPSRDALPSKSAVKRSEPTIKDVGGDLKVLGTDLVAFAWPRIVKSAVFAGRNARVIAVQIARGFRRARAALNRKTIAPPPPNDEPQAGQTQGDTESSPPPIQHPRPISDADQAATRQREDLACPRCRTVNQPGSLFCFNCGLPLDDLETTVAQTPILAHGNRPAGFSIRLVAWLIDAMILAVTHLAIIAVWPGIPEYFGSDSIIHWIDALLIILTALYYTISVSVWQTTVGKRAVSMYVLRPDGDKVTPLRAFARYFASVISFLLLGLGYLVIAFNPQKRAMHDVICDTVVVRM